MPVGQSNESIFSLTVSYCQMTLVYVKLTKNQPARYGRKHGPWVGFSWWCFDHLTSYDYNQGTWSLRDCTLLMLWEQRAVRLCAIHWHISWDVYYVYFFFWKLNFITVLPTGLNFMTWISKLKGFWNVSIVSENGEDANPVHMCGATTCGVGSGYAPSSARVNMGAAGGLCRLFSFLTFYC